MTESLNHGLTVLRQRRMIGFWRGDHVICCGLSSRPGGFPAQQNMTNPGAAPKRVLELGCGKVKAPGAIGVDVNFDATAANVIADLNQPLPFQDNIFDEVRAIHLIEHMQDVMKTLAEIHRVSKPGGSISLITPHYTDHSSWRDPTHRWHLSSFSFCYYGPMHGERHWYTRLELRERSLHVELARLWKYVGIQWLVNRFVWFRRFWEMYLCFIFRGKQMEFTFEVVK